MDKCVEGGLTDALDGTLICCSARRVFVFDNGGRRVTVERFSRRDCLQSLRLKEIFEEIDLWNESRGFGLELMMRFFFEAPFLVMLQNPAKRKSENF